MAFERGRRHIFIFVASIAVVYLLLNLLMLSGTELGSKIKAIQISLTQSSTITEVFDLSAFDDGVRDQHPISKLMEEADKAWAAYEENRSQTFREALSKYRTKYGRHPPPGFDVWYKFAREKNVYNVDDFDQVMDDLRPFWGVKPIVMRNLAAYMATHLEDGLGGVHIRDGKIWNTTYPGWRTTTLTMMIGSFVDKLPDMDIVMNHLDQPRVVVPWDDMQSLLKAEEGGREMLEVSPNYTKKMNGLMEYPWPNETLQDTPGWTNQAGKQFMKIAAEACPPESHARDKKSTVESAEALYKSSEGGFITNFNRSSDLCVVGPEIQDKHGYLFTATSNIVSSRLIPIFSECKVSVNSDILLPAMMYWRNDERYLYDDVSDFPWEEKEEVMIWRGATSGGTQNATNWKQMHRQRLVMLVNGTEMKDEKVQIMSETQPRSGDYHEITTFRPSSFAENYTDVGFIETWGCIPDCHFYDDIWTLKPKINLTEQFEYKYLVDVDGHSFSGRWRAFLQSKSLGIKSTIFREWHDSRLFAWRHFAPMDNRYDDLYGILTYFIGLGNGEAEKDNMTSPDKKAVDERGFFGLSKSTSVSGIAHVQRHDFAARKMAWQAREWANKVLRTEDMEIYLFRLLLEYGRLIDDNRDHIGYSGDGSDLDNFDRNSHLVGRHV